MSISSNHCSNRLQYSALATRRALGHRPKSSFTQARQVLARRAFFAALASTPQTAIDALAHSLSHAHYGRFRGDIMVNAFDRSWPRAERR